MISGILASRCGNATSNNALGVDSNGNLGLFPGGIPGPPNITWYLGVGFDTNGNPIGAYLQNKQSGGYLYVYWPDGILAPSLGIGPKSVFDVWSTWNFGTPRQDGYLAVRPVGNDDLNLNILGGCNGTNVGVWGWSGGDQNEIWIFAPDNVQAPPSSYRVIARCGGYLGVNSANGQVFYDGTFKRPPGIQLDQYVWKVEVAMGRTPVQKIPYPLSGFSLISTINNKAVRANGQGQAVSLVDLGSIDNNSAWGAGGGSSYAIRPLADDDQNLNVSGGCGGTQVVTYQWTGGNWNETWRIAP